MAENNTEKRKSLFDLEEETLKFWQENKIFEKSLEKNDKSNIFSFYDGPPFITGMPHYGTLLPSIAKDIIPRYQTMKGKYVRRVWGWDVHGLPAENQVEKQLGLKSKKDIEKMGIDKFIAACREYVKTGSEQWNWYVDHIGRWVDMEHSYRTDNIEFMESVMWIFKELYDKDLIYQGRRVSLYCPRCATPLSKFEITMDDENYKDVEDPAVTVAFKLKDQDAYVLAWTTTPWTLPSNLALAVDENAEYVKVYDAKNKRYYILAHEAMVRYDEMDWEIKEHIPGKDLVGKEYEPLFNFLATNPEKDYHIYAAKFVTMNEGTGVIHIAPAFGEEDFNFGQEVGLSILETLNDEGKFIEQVKPWAGAYYKSADPEITADLEKRQLLIKNETITHSFPHCYRCGTPLIYKSQMQWYLKISELKSKLLSENDAINWVPEHFGKGRFNYNIENAPDWSISRTRYWGSPIPVWVTENGEKVVVGSIKELEELSGEKITDLHRPKIDDVVLTLKDGRKAHRVKEVLDCWFESGAMPYAQFHYPFENKEEFEASYPTDFIVEYTGQLRGWFYYLHVLGNALMGKNSFKNVVVTGVLMGNDGRKMSKSYNNFPDPRQTLEKYGAESLRLFFMNSNVMAGGDLAVTEDDIREQSRLLGILHNSFKYFQTYAEVHKFKPIDDPENPTAGRENPTLIDRWILLRLEEFIIEYSEALDAFDFVKSSRAIRPFIEDLSTWYIRRSRDRFVAGDSAALETLHDVLTSFAKAVAPTLPFSAELIYRSLTGKTKENSVHLQEYPALQHDIVSENSNVLARMSDIREIASIAHKIRAEAGISLRQPLESLSIVGFKELETEEEFLEILKDELNISTITFDEVGGNFKCVEANGKKVCLNLTINQALQEEGQYRELLRALQDARKKAGLNVGERVTAWFHTDEQKISALIEKRREDIQTALSFEALIQKGALSGAVETMSGDLMVEFKKN